MPRKIKRYESKKKNTQAKILQLSLYFSELSSAKSAAACGETCLRWIAPKIVFQILLLGRTCVVFKVFAEKTRTEIEQTE